MDGSNDVRTAAEALARELGLAAEESPIEFLSSVLTAIPAFITRIDEKLIIRYINRVVPGIDRSEVVGKKVFDFISPEYHEIAHACFDAVQSTGQPGKYEAVAGAPNGEQFYYINHVTPVRDPDGSTGLCIVGIDVTAERQQAASLQQNEELLRLAIESTRMSVWSWDLATDTIVADERFKEICGVEETPGFQSLIGDLLHPDDRDLVNDALAIVMETRSLSSPPFRIIRPDGEVRWILTVGKILGDPGTPGRMVGGLLDITEQRSMEGQLRQAQKMEAVGNLTAGVAHNFNNMLMVILPTLDLVKSVVPATHQDMLENASHAGQRAAEMIRQLMTFSGQSLPARRERLHAEDVVAKAVLMAQGVLDRAIEFSSQSETSDSVECNAGDIEQVIVNILLNARDALTSAGTETPTISIRTDRASADEVADRGKAGTQYLRISITDNGPGMHDEVLRQIFEPFFTTKLPQGTGLGLAMSYAIIRDHAGWIHCRSSLGHGTTFEIYLPITNTATAPVTKERPTPLPNERPRVLVIDDEMSVRQITERVLQTIDFPVVTASGGAQARALLETDRDFQVVLLDRSMTDLRGSELVPMLRKDLPAAKIYYFTGEHVPPTAAPEVDGVLQKPLTAEGLIQALRLAK